MDRQRKRSAETVQLRLRQVMLEASEGPPIMVRLMHAHQQRDEAIGRQYRSPEGHQASLWLHKIGIDL
jgi:hypothetical protein